MGSPEPSSSRDFADWELLASLFAPEGPYRHRMGLRRFPAADFYAPTPEGLAIHAEKEAILERVGDRHTLVTPEGQAAAAEFAQFLALPVETTADEGGRSAFNWRLGLALEPDLLIVQPPEWSLVWANVCFPSRWSLADKSRRPLTWIHDAVPGLNDELAHKIAVFFARLPPGEGWRRANWGLSASALRNQHPDEPIPTLGAANGPDEIFVRVEDQHLLKLPDTGAIAFGIRIISFAWSAVSSRPALAASIVKKLQSMSPENAGYKGLARFIPPTAEER